MASGLIHQWIYTIVPAFQTAYPYRHPIYFAAYCKGCNKYFTEPIMTDETAPMLTSAHLPMDDCLGTRNTIFAESRDANTQ